MYMSIYPTDSNEVIDSIIKQAYVLGVDTFFTSLHIPESAQLFEFLEKIKFMHEKLSFNFFVDVSPNTFKLMNISDFSFLKNYGIIGLRIDFGFSTEEIISFSKIGLDIAINASTITEEELIVMKDVNLIGWHNFYPRVETAISVDFFEKQNELLRKFNIPIYAFIPGEINKRVPLFEGLPTLEIQRSKEAFINYLFLKKHYQVDEIIIAEGTVSKQNEFLINLYEKKKIIGIVVEDFNNDLYSVLKSKEFNIRIEETDFSWRVDNSRFLDFNIDLQSEVRTRGSIHMDNHLYGRYKNEIHLILKDLVLDVRCSKVGHISSEYIDILELLNKKPKVSFIKKEDL